MSNTFVSYQIELLFIFYITESDEPYEYWKPKTSKSGNIVNFQVIQIHTILYKHLKSYVLEFVLD